VEVDPKRSDEDRLEYYRQQVDGVVEESAEAVGQLGQTVSSLFLHTCLSASHYRVERKKHGGSRY
jgi:uncharacterized membrane-anchored protein YhcB (DUF1043 family)